MQQIGAKIRGSLFGGLIGDCLGGPFEGDFPISRSTLTNFFKKMIEETPASGAFQILPYTDDTAMARSVAHSLIACDGLDAKDMAKRFVTTYDASPKRGYGSNIGNVFAHLRAINYDDPFEGAHRQFGGHGSYGNGAAMRIAPVAVYALVNKLTEEKMIEIAIETSKITHTHHNGINGAILQCLAVREALKLLPAHAPLGSESLPVDRVSFLETLIAKIEPFEMAVDPNLRRKGEPQTPLTDKLRAMRILFSAKKTLEGISSDLTPEEAAVMYGHGVSAVESVPTAIYSFLRAIEPIAEFEHDNPIVRTLYLAISIGGDTDTIATMAGSIAGAFYSSDIIPEILIKHCEDHEEISKIAEDFISKIKED